MAPPDRGPSLSYEEALAQLPLNSMYLWEDEPAPDGVPCTLDARQPYVAPRWESDGGALPDTLKERMPLSLADGWSAVYSWSSDHHTLLAYVYQSGPSGSPALVLKGFPVGRLPFRLFGLAAKKIASEGTFEGSRAIGGLSNGRQFFVLVTGSQGLFNSR